jgi:hypothetical protein
MWPKRRFASVPGFREAVDLAEDVRRTVFGCDSRSDSRCDLKEICLHGGFVTKRLDGRFNSFAHDALLRPQKCGLMEIFVDPLPDHGERISEDLARHRNRFRIAHEIGHSFFYDRAKRPPTRLLPESKAEEKFCDEFANALLIPRSHVTQVEPTASNIFQLRKTFDVSVQVSGRALSRVYPEISVAGLMWRPHNRDNKITHGFRIVWWDGPRFMPLAARIHSRVVDEASRCGYYEDVEHLRVGAVRGAFRVSAAKLGERGRQVIVVLTPPSQSDETKGSVFSPSNLAIPNLE